jgi:UDP-N-acetylmuramoyl-tripeptide--D-alanyl-D-alanine ligase
LIADVLCQRYRTLKNHRSPDFSVNLPLTLLRLGPGHERAVVEMGSNAAGEIATLCDLALPAIGVVTNVGRPHALLTDSLPAIALANSELVQALPPAPDGIAILNFDDPNVRAMAEKTKAQVFFYGMDPRADLWADRVESMGLEGIRLRLHFHNESLFMRVPLLGRQSVHTVLRASAVGLTEGLTWQEIINGLLSAQSQLRLVAVESQNGAMILDDSYDASVESNLAALNLLEEMTGRKVAILGDMDEFGPYERQGRQMVGARAAEVCALLVTVGEGGNKIAEAAGQAGMRDWAIKSCADVLEAVEFLKEKLVPGDMALVKGARDLHMDRIVTALEAES